MAPEYAITNIIGEPEQAALAANRQLWAEGLAQIRTATLDKIEWLNASFSRRMSLAAARSSAKKT
jgi:hypothetical protein